MKRTHAFRVVWVLVATAGCSSIGGAEEEGAATSESNLSSARLDFCGDGSDQDAIGGDRICAAPAVGSMTLTLDVLTSGSSEDIEVSTRALTFPLSTRWATVKVVNHSAFRAEYEGALGGSFGWIGPRETLDVNVGLPGQLRVRRAGGEEKVVTLARAAAARPRGMNLRLVGTASPDGNPAQKVPTELIAYPHGDERCDTDFQGSVATIHECVGYAKCATVVRIEMTIGATRYNFVPPQCPALQPGQSYPPMYHADFTWEPVSDVPHLALTGTSPPNRTRLTLSGTPDGVAVPAGLDRVLPPAGVVQGQLVDMRSLAYWNLDLRFADWSDAAPGFLGP